MLVIGHALRLELILAIFLLGQYFDFHYIYILCKIALNYYIEHIMF